MTDKIHNSKKSISEHNNSKSEIKDKEDNQTNLENPKNEINPNTENENLVLNKIKNETPN